MTSQVNVPAVLIVNLMGIMILFVIAVGNSWQAKTIFKENKSLRVLFFSCFALCIADPICTLANGKPGAINFFLVYFFNLCLYIGNIITAIMFVKLIIDRLDIKPHLIYKLILILSASTNVVMILLNLFIPVVFYVDADNVYHRAGAQGILNIFYVIVILSGLVIYLIERRKSCNIKFFPIWAFLIPAAIGMIIQTQYYGVSTITPFITVGLICIFINFQNEFIYRDKLTGLYNRFYMEMLGKKVISNPKYHYSAMMLDLNGFKEINDTFGHETGDKALILFARILRNIIGMQGEVFRYAGDEFVVIYYTQDEGILQGVIAEIHQALAEVSEEEDVPFKLSVAIGYCAITNVNGFEDKFIDKMDQLMYINKREYHKAKSENDRRKGD